MLFVGPTTCSLAIQLCCGRSLFIVTLRGGQWHYTWSQIYRLFKVLLAWASANFLSLQQKLKTFISYFCFPFRKLVVFLIGDSLIYRERMLCNVGVCL